jgi:hypothetical protein
MIGDAVTPLDACGAVQFSRATANRYLIGIFAFMIGVITSFT